MKIHKTIHETSPKSQPQSRGGAVSARRSRADVGLLALLAVAVAVLAGAARAEDAAEREAKLKAAFVYNFVQFMEWPASAFDGPDAPIVIAVVGKDPVGAALERATAGKKVAGRAVRVTFVGADDVGRCHALFVSAAQSVRQAQALAQVKGKPVIAVGEAEDFLAAGGTIRLFTEDNKMRFEVSLGAAERAAVRVSSKLLRLAKIYDEVTAADERKK